LYVDPALCGIALDHDPALCGIARDHDPGKYFLASIFLLIYFVNFFIKIWFSKTENENN
jgi:hypothetical protein